MSDFFRKPFIVQSYFSNTLKKIAVDFLHQFSPINEISFGFGEMEKYNMENWKDGENRLPGLHLKNVFAGQMTNITVQHHSRPGPKFCPQLAAADILICRY